MRALAVLAMQLTSSWHALQAHVPLALLDASIPQPVFHHWHRTRGRRALFASLAAAFSLIIPHSDIEVGRFRLLGATLPQMPGWCNDLAYACALSTPVANLWRPTAADVADLVTAFAGRDTWLVCNATSADEQSALAAHGELAKEFPSLLTVLVPADASHARDLVAVFGAAHVKAVVASALPMSRAPRCRSVDPMAMSGLLVQRKLLTPAVYS